MTGWFARVSTTQRLAAAVLIFAAVLRSIGVSSRWLWLDELLSANFSVHGPVSALVNVLRFDVHPPFYYLQLSLWSLLGRDDLWLMMNSIFWSTAAVGMLIHAASRLYDWRTGVGAGMLLAVAPAVLDYADDVRMYAFLVFVIVWVWYVQERWLRGTAGRWGWLWMIVSQTAVVSSHTAGVVMLSGCVLYGASRVIMQGNRRAMLLWFLIEIAVAIFALPALAIGTLRSVIHTRAPDLSDLTSTWAFLAVGDVGGSQYLIPAAAVIALAAYAAILVYRPALRVLAATLIFTPLVVAALISDIVKPIWIDRIFLTTIPFTCLIVALAATNFLDDRRQSSRLAAAAFALLLAVWTSIALVHQFTREKGDGFKPSADLVRELARPGDVVLVDGDFDYWCFMWYYAGPDWGEPRHAFILNDDWRRMMARLPPQAASVMDLNQSDTTHRSRDITVQMWDRSLPPPVASGNVIVVRTQASNEPVLPGRKRTDSTHLQQLLVERWVIAPS